MNCDELSDLILFHAGGVAEEEESRRVLAHLEAGCPRCAGRFAESRAILAPLPLALGSVAPGADVRLRLMAKVAAAGRDRGRPEPDVVSRGIKTSDASTRFVRMWVVPSIAAALAAAFVGLAVYTPMNRDRLALEARIAQQEGRLRTLQSEVERAKRTLQLLRSPAVQVVSLSGAETPRAAGRILWDKSRRQWHFFAADLQPLPPGRTYQLWFITGDQRMVSAGTFDVDDSGQGELVASVPEGLAPIVLAAVTDEPAGGMPQPTGKIQIKGEIPASS